MLHRQQNQTDKFLFTLCRGRIYVNSNMVYTL